jgi:hypothetical protein
MGWLRGFFVRRREVQAQRIIGELFEKYGLEVGPEFPDFVDWLENAPLHESAAVLARILGNDPDFPRNGPYSAIRAYFDGLLRDEPELNEIAGQLAQTWMMEKANHSKIRVKDS